MTSREGWLLAGLLIWFANGGDGSSDDGFELSAGDTGDGASGGVNGALVGGESDGERGGFELGGHSSGVI